MQVFSDLERSVCRMVHRQVSNNILCSLSVQISGWILSSHGINLFFLIPYELCFGLKFIFDSNSCEFCLFELLSIFLTSANCGEFAYAVIFSQVATIAWFEADSVCGSHSTAIPLLLVIPYLCRLLQCLRQYKDTKEKTTLFNGNIGQYFPVCLPIIFRYGKILMCLSSMSRSVADKLSYVRQRIGVHFWDLNLVWMI